MFTATNKPTRRGLSIVSSVAVALTGLAAMSHTARAVQPESPQNALEVFDLHYDRLVSEAPADPRLPYTRALLLVHENRYGEASEFTRQSLAKSAKDLDVWKLDIWLRVRNGDFNVAFDRVERLASKLPDESAEGVRRRRGDEIAHFFGQVCGHLIGPREEDLPSDFDYRVERVVNGLTTTQSAAFDRGLQGVMARFASLSDRIDQARREQIDAAYRARESRMGEIALERDRLRGELASLDALRLKGMEVAANERNVLATTREEAAGGSAIRQREAHVADTEHDAFAYRGPKFEAKRIVGVGPSGGWIAGDSYGYKAPDISASSHRGSEAYLGATDAASGFAVSKGFGSFHYVDVNQREKDYETQLARRRTSMMKQLRNLAREEKDLLGEPPTGASSRIARMQRKAERLATYIPLPIDIESELRELKS